MVPLFVFLAAVLSMGQAFSPSYPSFLPSRSSNACATCTTRVASSLFGGLFGGRENDADPNTNVDLKTNGNNSNSPVPITKIFDIPTKGIKPGPLRFFLSIYLVGEMQNKPEPGSWKSETDADAGVLDIYYKDKSAMCKISITDNGIVMERHGSPSLQYLLQESVMLHSVLDELNKLAFLEDVEEEKRLIRFEKPPMENMLEKAREKLPARAA